MGAGMAVLVNVAPTVLADAVASERRESKRVTGSMEHSPETPCIRHWCGRVAVAQHLLDELVVSGLVEQCLLALAGEVDAVEVVHAGNPFNSAIRPR